MADRPELDDFWLTVRLSASLLGCALLLLLRVPILQGLGWCVGCVTALCCRCRRERLPPTERSMSARHPRNSRAEASRNSRNSRREASTPRARRDARKTITDQALETFVDRFKRVRERLDKMKIQRNMGDQLSYVQEVKALRAFRRSMEYSVFIGHVRSKDNFMRSHRDPLLRLPPAYTAERAVAAHWVGILYYVLLSSGRMQSEMVNSLALALISTALAPWAWFVSSHADVYADTEHAETIGALQLFIAQARSQVDSLVSHYSFFPVFLLLGLLSYVTLRWREWLVNSHTVQAALHDVGVLVGASIVAPDERAKDTVYELYRLLNDIHAVLYKSVVPHLPQDVAGLVDLGLLTSGEAELLEPTANKQRDVLVTWAGQKVEALRRSGHIAGGAPVALAHSILKLRGICARHHDLFVRHMPNVWFAASRLLIDFLIFFLLIKLPLSVVDSAGLDAHRHAALSIHCVITAMGAFFVAFAFGAAWSVVALLSNPFAAELDTYNVDPLLASTERCLFVQLRAGIIDRESVSRAGREPLAPAADDLGEDTVACVHHRRMSTAESLTGSIGTFIRRGSTAFIRRGSADPGSRSHRSRLRMPHTGSVLKRMGHSSRGEASRQPRREASFVGSFIWKTFQEAEGSASAGAPAEVEASAYPRSMIYSTGSGGSACFDGTQASAPPEPSTRPFTVRFADAAALQTAVDFEESERACGMEISKTVHRTSADM